MDTVYEDLSSTEVKKEAVASLKRQLKELTSKVG